MKTTTIQAVTREDYLSHLAKQIEQAHTVSKSGGRRGGQQKTALSYGITPALMANVMNGYGSPTKKMLERDGLEERRVYVKIQGK